MVVVVVSGRRLPVRLSSVAPVPFVGYPFRLPLTASHVPGARRDRGECSLAMLFFSLTVSALALPSEYLNGLFPEMFHSRCRGAERALREGIRPREGMSMALVSMGGGYRPFRKRAPWQPLFYAPICSKRMFYRTGSEQTFRTGVPNRCLEQTFRTPVRLRAATIWTTIAGNIRIEL